MKRQDVSQNSAAITQRGRRVDFLFVGVGVIPAVLMFGGRPEMAILLFIPLLFAACLCGMWEQVASQGAPNHRSADSRERPGVPSLPNAGVTLRERGDAADRLDCKLPASAGDTADR